jgi:serine/threonine-protein kinase RsbW
VEIKLTLALPREELSVPAVRRVLAASMQALGVTEQTIADIEVALSEACTNVLDHAGGGSEYEVSAGIDGSMCVIEVIDRGPGFDSDGKGMADAAPQAEGGRGIQLMRELVDRVTFTNRPTEGTVVHLEKQLEWNEGAVMAQLSETATTVRSPWSKDSAPLV